MKYIRKHGGGMMVPFIDRLQGQGPPVGKTAFIRDNECSDFFSQTTKAIVQAITIFFEDPNNRKFDFNDFEGQIKQIASYNDKTKMLLSPITAAMQIDWVWINQKPIYIFHLRSFFEEIRKKILSPSIQVNNFTVDQYKEGLGVTEYAYDQRMREIVNEVFNRVAAGGRKKIFPVIINGTICEVEGRELERACIMSRSENIGIYTNPFDETGADYVILNW